MGNSQKILIKNLIRYRFFDQVFFLISLFIIIKFHSQEFDPTLFQYLKGFFVLNITFSINSLYFYFFVFQSILLSLIFPLNHLILAKLNHFLFIGLLDQMIIFKFDLNL